VFACGARTGVRSVSTPSDRRTVDCSGGLCVTVPDEGAHGALRTLKVQDEVAGHLSDPLAVRICRNAGEMDDSELAPAGILPCQSTDQLDMLIGDRGTTRSPMRIALSLPDDLRMPGRHRRRGHHQGRPPAVGEEPSGKGEKCPIDPGGPGTWRTSLQDLELVAEHNDLGILLDAVETMDPKNLEGSTDQTAEKREGHSRKGSPQASDLVKLAFGHVHSTGVAGGQAGARTIGLSRWASQSTSAASRMGSSSVAVGVERRERRSPWWPPSGGVRSRPAPDLGVGRTRE